MDQWGRKNRKKCPPAGVGTKVEFPSLTFLCQKVHSFQKSSSIVSVLPAALRAGASLPSPLALSCYWDGGGVGTIEHVSKG